LGLFFFRSMTFRVLLKFDNCIVTMDHRCVGRVILIWMVIHRCVGKVILIWMALFEQWLIDHP
jgi:hypothetical protein